MYDRGDAGGFPRRAPSAGGRALIRWLRLAALAVAFLAVVLAGAVVGLFVVENESWVRVEVPPLLTGVLGEAPLEVWLPGLLSSWLVAALAAFALVAGSFYYLWRRRQYEALIRRLEVELTELRNLPLNRPAPLEDLPEQPDAAQAAAIRAEDEAVAAEGEGRFSPERE